MPPAAPFPVEAMGPIMAKATKAFQEEIQAPMAMCGNAVLASAALAVQAHYDVQMPHGIAPTSLYFASVAKSGERKTGTDKKVLKPVREFEDELRKDYDRERRDYLDAKDVWETSRKRTLTSKLDDAEKREELKNLGPEPRPPLKPIRAVSDVTAEGLAGLLELMLSGGLFATEGGQFTGGHAMSDDAKLRNAAFFSRLWDDGYVDRVRARQEEVVLRHRRLSVHLQLQPDVAFRFFSDPVLRDQGLHSRFLISYPDSVMGQRQYMPKVSLEHATAQVAFAARIKELLRTPAPIRDEDPFSPDPKPLPLSANAETLFIKYVDQIESELGPHGALAPISGLANKLPEHSARIAAVIAAVEDRQLKEIDEAAVTGGILLASHYAAEARRIALMSQGQIELQEAQGLWDWLDTKWRTEHGHISITDLLWRGPNSIRDKAKAEELVSILESHGYLRPAGEQIIGGKKRRKTWTIWTAAA
jgi:hypothetical protein